MAETLGPLSFQPQACLRSLRIEAARSSCTRCQEVCARDAIRLDPLDVDPARCDRCRLCIPACPSTALSESDAARRANAGTLAQIEPGATFAIACGCSSSPSAGPSARAPCLAAVDPAMGVAALARGATRLELHDGGCADCRLGSVAASTVQDLADRFSPAAVAFGAEVDRVSSPPRAEARAADPVRDPVVSRRAVFGSLFGQGRELAHAAATTFEERVARANGDEAKQRGPGDARALAADAMRRRPPLESTPVAIGGTPRVDGETCSACGLCVAACAPEAIAQPNDGGALVLTAERCTGCQACVAACDDGVLKVDATTDIATWGRDGVAIARPRETGCMSCGEAAISADIPYCPTCYRTTWWTRAAQAERQGGSNPCSDSATSS